MDWLRRARERAERWLLDRIAGAAEREQMRVETTLADLAELDEAARQVVKFRKHRPGPSWEMDLDHSRLRMRGLAYRIGDADLIAAVMRLDALQGNLRETGAESTACALDAALDGLLVRAGWLRREALR